MTIEQIYKDFTEKLKKIYEAREATNITDWVFEKVAGVSRLERVTNKQKLLDNSTVEQLNENLRELLLHRPVQYVLEEAWFYKMKFFVNEYVLIPRPETEELVEWIADDLKIKNEKLKIIDVGTGSGCIAIALKKNFTTAEILAIDISANALSVARLNASGSGTALGFFQIDFLDETQWNRLLSFDIIVSNPPYISENEKTKMKKNVVNYEPHLALFVKDADPFIFYKKIAVFASMHLNREGKIYVEVHEKYADQVKEIFTQYRFKTIIKKDMYGKERMMSAYR